MPPRPRPDRFGKKNAQGRKTETTVTLFVSLPAMENTNTMLILLGEITRGN